MFLNPCIENMQVSFQSALSIKCMWNLIWYTPYTYFQSAGYLTSICFEVSPLIYPVSVQTCKFKFV